MGKDEWLHPQVVFINLLKSGDVDVHMNNGVGSVAVAGQDVTELALNTENVLQEISKHGMCPSSVCNPCCIHLSKLRNFLSKPGEKKKGNAEKFILSCG